MKLSYLQLAKYSLETSVQHMLAGNDRELLAGIVLGHHAITCFMKAAAQKLGQKVERGTSFSGVIGYLNKDRYFEKGETKALELLNKVRNNIEHDEPDFLRTEFEVALSDCMHIVERLCGSALQLDLQNDLSSETWGYLIEIAKFGDERKSRLYDLLSDALGVYGKDRYGAIYEYISCPECNQDGLLWRGGEKENLKCKYCGELTLVKRCLVCQWVIYPGVESTFEGSVHQECFDRWGE